MTKVMSKRIKATILYATETGKSETFAQKLAKFMHMSFYVQIQCMEDYSFENLTSETLLLIVTSTFGNGEAPDNGKVIIHIIHYYFSLLLNLLILKAFWKQLYKMSRDETQPKLTNLKYAVFALGSTQYPTFCAFGKNVDKALQNIGGTQVLPIGLGDELRGQEQAFHGWALECYKTSCQQFKIDISQNELLSSSFEEAKYDPKNVRITEVTLDSSLSEHHVHHELARLHHKKILPCKVVSRVRLQPMNSDRQTLLVRLSPSNQIARNMFSYEPGDHLGIFPSNPPEIVDALLGHLRRAGYDDPNSAILQVENLVDGKWTADSRLPPCSLRVALTNYLDITTPPTQRFIEYLIDMANDRWDSFRLKKLSTVRNDVQQFSQ